MYVIHKHMQNPYPQSYNEENPEITPMKRHESD